MVESTVINWIIINIEILVAIIWASLFCTELFNFVKLPRISYHFDNEYHLKVKKTWGSVLGQIGRSFVNLFLLSLVVVISFSLTGTGSELLPSTLDPLLEIIPGPIELITAGIALLLIPKRVYGVLISPYWTRQWKYFLLLGCVFLPLFLLDLTILHDSGNLGFLIPEYSTIVGIFLPTQLLAENGTALNLEEKQQYFLVIFILFPLALSFLVQFLPRLFRRVQRYGIFEWKENGWQTIDAEAYDYDDDTAVLLLHGLGSKKEVWSTYSRERSSERIMDFIERNTSERYLRTKVFALDFSNKLKDSFSTKYKVASKKSALAKGGDVSLNNYVWEVIFAILLLKEVKEIERLHIIAHSSGGLILRKMLQELYDNPDVLPISGLLGFENQAKSIDFIDKVSWLAVPHFGAKGGTSILLLAQDTFLLKYAIRLLTLLPMSETVLDRLGRVLILLGLDAQAAHDIDPRSRYIKMLNTPGELVTLFGRHEYKNAIATEDLVVGSGAIIGKRFRQVDTRSDLEEKEFYADHGNAPWEQLQQLPDDRINDVAPLHHSLELIYWLLNE